MLKNRYVIRTLPEMRETIANILSSITEGRSVDEASLFNIRLVLNELIVNAFIHGNADAQDAPVTVLVDPDETEPALTIEVEDGGVGFSAAPPAEQAEAPSASMAGPRPRQSVYPRNGVQRTRKQGQRRMNL